MVLKFKADNMDAAKVQQFMAQATQLATQRFQQETSAQKAITGVLDDVTDKYAEQARQLTLSGKALEIEVEYTRLKAEADKALLNVMGPLTEEQQRQYDSLHDLARAHVELAEKSKLDQEAAKGWQSIWSSAATSVADTFAKVLVEGGSLFDGLKNLAKQTVEQIIAYFARLAVINPILNSIFGGGGMMGAGFQMLPTMANSVMGGGAISNGSATAGATGGGGFQLFSPSTWMSAGQTMFTGFKDAATTFWGGSATNPASANFMGPPVEGQVMGSGYGGYGSGLAQGIGIATSVYAGYSRFKSAGGGAAGVAGGLTYAAGTYAAGAGMASVVAGTGFAAGVSGAFAAIPVVGWIALAAMIVDKLSGGKLFGTAYQTKASTTSLNLGPDGANATAFLSQSKQGALFSGTKWREKAVDAGADAQKAAQDLFDAVERTMVTAAHKIEVEVPPMIAAALSVQNTYDKHGKVTATTYGVTIGGKKYDEDSQEKAVERIQAEAIIASVAASKIGEQASAIAEQWRLSADALMDGANFLLAATTDITRGLNLLGDGGTLSDIADLVTSLQQGNEALVDAYQRLGAETEIVQQAIELTGVNLGKTGKAMVEFADDVASAAGGVNALGQLVQQFDQAYFSPAEIAKVNADQAKKASDRALTQLGENPLESMAQFKADFLAVLPTLSPEKLAQWYAAGVALATYTAAVTSSAQQIGDAKQKYAAFEMQLRGDDFLQALSGTIAAEQQQIDTANALAKAAGLAGASQEDLARIMSQGSYQIGAALAKLTSDIAADVATINGATNAGNGPDDIYAVANNKAAVQAAQAQQQATQSAAAYDAIEKIGEYAFASGKSVADVLRTSGTSAEQLAKILGISPEQVTKQIAAAVDNAASLTKLAANGDVQTGLLANILAVLQGKTPTYDVSQLGAPPTIELSSTNKLGGPSKVAAPLSARELTQAVGDGTESGMSELAAELRELNAYLRGSGRGATINRNTAGRLQFIQVN